MLKVIINTVLLFFISTILASCMQNEKLKEFDQITQKQSKSLDANTKTKTCAKSEKQNDIYKSDIVDLLWKQASSRPDNKLKKSFIENQWMSFVATKDDGTFGHKFSKLRNLTLLNIRYASNLKCPWVKKSI